MASAIPVNSVVTLSAAAAGLILDDEVPSFSSRWEPVSPEGGSISEASDHSQTKEIEKDGRKNVHYLDDNTSEGSENHSDGLERVNGSCDYGQTPLEVGNYVWHRSQTMEHMDPFSGIIVFRCSYSLLCCVDGLGLLELVFFTCEVNSSQEFCL